jgi:hypothetical protein
MTRSCCSPRSRRATTCPGTRHPDWTAALSSLPEDVQPFMQLRMGNAITGRIPESDDAMMLQGNGAATGSPS